MRDAQQSTPPDATHWSVRSMAKHAGIGKSKVQQIWSARGLKPHLVETFKLSTDVQFEDKLVDVFALYLNPPGGAVVLSVDEKSQIAICSPFSMSIDGEFVTMAPIVDRPCDTCLQSAAW